MCPSTSWRGLLSQREPLQRWRCSSFSTRPPPPPLFSPPLHFRPRLLPSPDALLCFLPRLLPSLRMRCSAPLPRCSPSRSTAAAVPFQIEQPVARRRRNRADGGEETAQLSGIDEETAESRGHQHVHKATRRRLTPKASLERPDA
jgi:hypothetical protein